MSPKEKKIFIEMLVGSVRNSELENLHSGKPILSKTGDFTDVKVVTPYGELPWNEVSRISNKEMGRLKDSIRDNFKFILKLLIDDGLEINVKNGSSLKKIIKSFKL